MTSMTGQVSKNMLMSANIKSKKGITLLEVLVAITIMIAVSFTAINLLFDTVTERAKQYAIQESGKTTRLVMKKIRDAVVYADLVTVDSSNELQVQGSPCTTIRYNLTDKSVEQATDNGASCTPPDSGFVSLTPGNIEINSLVFEPVGDNPKNISVEITGIYKDNMSDYQFSHQTSLTPRITL